MEIEKRVIKGVVSEYTGFIWIGILVGIILFIVGVVFSVLNIIYSNLFFLILGTFLIILGLIVSYVFNKIRQKVNGVVDFTTENVKGWERKMIER
jgi:sulfite exporter TauE/SafE